MVRVSWIGAEWDGRQLCAWAVGPDGAVAARASQQPETGADPVAALTALIAPWQRGALAPVLACGLPDAPAVTLPCPPFIPGRMQLPRPGAPWLVPGLTQTAPADTLPAGAAMRLAGCLAANPRFDGVICLVGTLCHWAQISAGEVVGTVTTAAPLFHAALAAFGSVAFVPSTDDTANTALFAAAVGDCLSRPEQLMRLLAEAQALPPGSARARLQGALIGAELAATRRWWLGQRVLVLGGGAGLSAGHYHAALAAQGVAATEGADEPALLAGLAMVAQTVAQMVAR